jgi:hypothetical protein
MAKKVTMMTDKMHALLYYLYQDKEAFRPVPEGTHVVTLKNMQGKDWITTSEDMKWAKLTGLGLVALRTSKIYPQYAANVQKPEIEQPVEVVAEVANMPAAVEIDLECDDCLDCYAVQLLERLQKLDPRIKKVIEAWAAAKSAERELMG